MKTLAVLNQPLVEEDRGALCDLGNHTIWVPLCKPTETTVKRLIELHIPETVVLDEKLDEHWALMRQVAKTTLVRTRPTLRAHGKVFVFASSDTLVRSLVPVAKNLGPELSVHYFIPDRSVEKAGQTFRSVGIEPRQNILAALVREKPQALVLANDWNYDSRLITRCASRLGVRTVCIQESVINLADVETARMLQADHAIVQGVATTKMLRRRQHWLAGNPRYEELCPTPPTSNGKVFINCNFTYGIQSEFREKWLEGCTGVLKKLGLEYFIAQHPRDFADVSRFGDVVSSNAGVVHELIRDSVAVVSRFSSVLHEAVAMGRPAAYFNPHRELAGYDFSPHGLGLGYAENPLDLENWLKAAVLQRRDFEDNSLEQALQRYASEHFRPMTEKPSKLCGELISDIIACKPPRDGRGNSTMWMLKGLKEVVRGAVHKIDR